MDGSLSGVGTTPTLTFDPPSLGSPDAYTVIVRSLEDISDTDGNVLSRHRTVANYTTYDTSVTLPEGILETGKYYTLLVRAELGSDPESSGFSAVMAYGVNTTGAFTP